MSIPETKWVDGAKLLFTANIVLKSTIYSQVYSDSMINSYVTRC